MNESIRDAATTTTQTQPSTCHSLFSIKTMTSLQRAAGMNVSVPPRSEINDSTRASGGMQGMRRPRPQKRGAGGIFEASFGGLDLSEFGDSTATRSTDGIVMMTNTGNVSALGSAAAELLRQKKVEAEEAHREAKEEATMEANAIALAKEQTRRLALLKEQRDVEGRSNGKEQVVATEQLMNRPVEGTELMGKGMFSTLVSMHSDDYHGARREPVSGKTGASLRAKAAASVAASASASALTSTAAPRRQKIRVGDGGIKSKSTSTRISCLSRSKSKDRKVGTNKKQKSLVKQRRKAKF